MRPKNRQRVRSTLGVAILSAALAAAAQTPGPSLPANPVAAAPAALSFAEALAAAQQYDPQYRGAIHELESARLGVPVARASLLPAVTLSAATSEVQGYRQFPNSLDQDVRVRVEYTTPQAALTLRMPILNQEASKRLAQTEAQVEGAEIVHRSRGLDLLDRVANAYLSVLLAEDGLALAREQEQAERLRVRQAEQRMQRGEGTRIDVAQAQASVDQARVRVIEADDQLQSARRQLKAFIGMPVSTLLRLADAVNPAGGESLDDLNEWLALAMRHNPQVQARVQSVVVARLAVDRNRAGHLPRLDLVASLSRNQNESISNLNQISTLRSVGVQLSVPIFNGGGISAGVQQAQADVDRAEAELVAERERVALDVQRFHQTVAGGTERLRAHERSVQSNELALAGLRRGVEAGVATLADVGDAQARLYSTRRDLLRARVELLMAMTKLRLSAGLPLAEIAQALDRALTQPSLAPQPRS